MKEAYSEQPESHIKLNKPLKIASEGNIKDR